MYCVYKSIEGNTYENITHSKLYNPKQKSNFSIDLRTEIYTPNHQIEYTLIDHLSGNMPFVCVPCRTLASHHHKFIADRTDIEYRTHTSNWLGPRARSGLPFGHSNQIRRTNSFECVGAMPKVNPYVVRMVHYTRIWYRKRICIAIRDINISPFCGQSIHEHPLGTAINSPRRQRYICSTLHT